MRAMLCGVRIPSEWNARITQAMQNVGRRHPNGYALEKLEAHLGMTMGECKKKHAGNFSDFIRSAMQEVWGLPDPLTVADSSSGRKNVKRPNDSLRVELKPGVSRDLHVLAEELRVTPQLLAARIIAETVSSSLSKHLVWTYSANRVQKP
jgi:hypothetical protein